ncbi:MAG TPA: hypothetical protein VKN99_12560 [Polyangia bacterium]|nr:hypothetical protein [Polyangia bacterium]
MRIVTLLGVLVLCAATTVPARAAVSVRGTVVLPSALRAPPERSASFWPRIENGILPIAPPPVSPMSEVVVVLEGGPTTTSSWAGNVVMEIVGADLSPRVLPVLVGTTVEFKNTDRLTYTLYSPDNASFFAKEETPPGKSRKIKFLTPSVVLLRVDEFPHMEGAILVMQSPLYARPEDNGHFKIEGVSEGHYKLRVFLRGNLVYEQSVDVGRVSLEVPVKVPAPSRRTE